MTKTHQRTHSTILEPFSKNGVLRLFPGDSSRDMVFHQDSASSRTANHTIQYLKDNHFKVITTGDGMPKSPNAVQIYYGIWGILKRRLPKRTVNFLTGLKRALTDEWRKLDLETIYKTLASWSKRCRMIYYCHISQI